MCCKENKLLCARWPVQSFQPFGALPFDPGLAWHESFSLAPQNSHILPHWERHGAKVLPGSSQQGVFLGCFFFMVKFNGALITPNIPKSFPKPIPMIDSKASYCIMKYIDDASQVCAINLKKSLKRTQHHT